jgi:DNA-binding CsgD family transcriptional regulator
VITAATVLQLSRQLLEVPRAGYLEVAADCIHELIPGDDVVWIQGNWKDDSFTVWRRSLRGRDASAEQILRCVYQSPVVQSCIQAPVDLSPRRLSDLSDLSALDDNAAAVRQAQQYIGREQLCLMVNVYSPVAGRCWVITRDDEDFSDREMADAEQILPVLYLLDHFHHPEPMPTPSGLPVRRADLTTREGQVVDLLTTGMTAAAIGRILGISERTVSKHVQNAYDKLGVHDRLLVAADRRSTDQLRIPPRRERVPDLAGT